jgi:hypothetical protein
MPGPTVVKPEQIGQTPRYRRLSRLRAYYDGTQYRGMPDFWTGEKGNGEVVPLRERAPCIIYPLPRAAVNQATRFCFGEGRFPAIKIDPVEGSEAIGGLALSEDEAEVLERVAAAIIDQAKLRGGQRMALRGGLSVGTSVAILKVRGGHFELEFPHAEDCWPTFKVGSCSEVESLEWCYQFQKLVTQEDGTLVELPHYFRRTITATEYIVWEDCPVERGKEPKWVRDEEQTVAHGLGFCPVVWTKNLAEEFGGDIDGVSIYGGELDEFDALNLALSQRHRGINYWGCPQPWETGVADGTGPAAAARTAHSRTPKDNERTGYTSTGGGRPARKASVDTVWTYADEKAKVGLLETTGAAFEAATKHVLDIRSRVLEAIDVILLDPTTVAGKGDVSAKALALMYAPMLGLVDELRDCWWPDGLGAILAMAFRMLAKVEGMVLIPMADKAKAILARFEIDVEGERTWTPPKMKPVWGAYFSPSGEETKTAVETAAMAKEKGLVTAEAALRFVADDFGIEDIDGEVEQVEADALEASQQALDAELTLQGAAAEAGAKDDDDEEPVADE